MANSTTIEAIEDVQDLIVVTETTNATMPLEAAPESALESIAASALPVPTEPEAVAVNEDKSDDVPSTERHVANVPFAEINGNKIDDQMTTEFPNNESVLPTTDNSDAAPTQVSSLTTTTMDIITDSPSATSETLPSQTVTETAKSVGKPTTTTKKIAAKATAATKTTKNTAGKAKTNTKTTGTTTTTSTSSAAKTSKTSNLVKQPAPVAPAATKKIPVRKASLPGVLGSLSTTNVRAMQLELLNKSAPPVPSKSNTLSSAASSSRPSKIVPPKVYPKPGTVSSALSERITKFIKPAVTAATNPDTTNGKQPKNSNGSTAGASTSAGPSTRVGLSTSKQAAVASGSGDAGPSNSNGGGGGASGSRPAPFKIPKKKYHETCFSDDYESSTTAGSHDDDDEDDRRNSDVDSDDSDDGRPNQTAKRLPARRQQSLPNIMRSELQQEEEEEISVEVTNK